MITNTQTGTALDEISDGIYRISTPVTSPPGGFSYNQYLIADRMPLLYHTGPRAMFRFVCEAIERVLPVEELRYLCFSHFESDECGSVNQFLERAPEAALLCGRIGAMLNADAWDRRPQPLEDGATLELGHHRLQWLDAPHLPHAWDCGHLFDASTRTLFCGDLFTQPGPGRPALTRADILESSESLRATMDYYAHGTRTRELLEKLSGTRPVTLACMHGSAWEGDGASLLKELGSLIVR